MPTVILNPALARLADGATTYTPSRFGSPPQPIGAVGVPPGRWSVGMAELADGRWMAFIHRPDVLAGTSETVTFDVTPVATSDDCAAAYFAALDWANAGPGTVTVPALADLFADRAEGAVR